MWIINSLNKMKFLILITIFAFAQVCTSESIKNKWKTWSNLTLPKICDNLHEYEIDAIEICNESFLFYKFLFQTKYADWHGDILEVISLASHGHATESDLAQVETFWNGIDTLDHTINEHDLTKLHDKLVKFLTPSQLNYTMNFYRAFSAEDTSSLHSVIVRLFADVRNASLTLAEKDLSKIISHNNLFKEIYNNEQSCTLSFVDGFFMMSRMSNCMIPTFPLFCNRNESAPEEEDPSLDIPIVYMQYVIDTPSGELEVINLALNGNATKADLARVGHVLNNTMKVTDQGLKKLTEELSKCQTPEQTNYTMSFLMTTKWDHEDFGTFLADLFDKANKTLFKLSEKDRLELISHNKLLKTIQVYKKKCRHTFLDSFGNGIKTRNCLEPTFENYCSAMKMSPNIQLSIFGHDISSEKPNSLYLLFKYISGTTITKAERDVFDVINLAVNGNATATDYDNVMKLLNDIGPVDRREDLLRALQTELETFQSTQQTNYTINFYQNLLNTIKQSESSIDDLFLKANATILNLSETDRAAAMSRNNLLHVIYENKQSCVKTDAEREAEKNTKPF